MERRRKWSLKMHIGVSSLIMLLFQFISGFFNTNRQAASIGIIGGADGPTAIFITGKIADRLFSINYYSIFLFIILLLLYKPVKLRIERKI